jgi:ABC-2 type transport system ATP-binding protein
VLLLDEPSAALDPRQRERLWRFLEALVAQGTTIVFSTHNVNEAERNAHRIVVLADGELLFEGSAEELALDADFESGFVEFLRQRGH